MANLTEAERDLFVTDDKDTIMRVWQGLKKRKEKAVISVHVNRLSGLPMSCARSKGIYCVFRVFQDTGRTPVRPRSRFLSVKQQRTPSYVCPNVMLCFGSADLFGEEDDAGLPARTALPSADYR